MSVNTSVCLTVHLLLFWGVPMINPIVLIKFKQYLVFISSGWKYSRERISASSVIKYAHNYWLCTFSVFPNSILGPKHNQPLLNNCWLLVNWTLGDIFKWNLNQNTTIFIEENQLEMSERWRPFCLCLNMLCVMDLVYHATKTWRSLHFSDKVRSWEVSQYGHYSQL